MNDKYDNMADATYKVKVATCSKCASRRVIISSGRADPADPKTEVWTVSCGDEHHIGCTNSVSSHHVDCAISGWNCELYKEISDGIEDPAGDWAKEIVRR